MAQAVWYKTFPFRVSFMGWDLFGTYLAEAGKIKQLLKDQGHEHRSRFDANFNVYLKTPEAVQALVTAFNDEILIMYGPVSEKHQDLMLNDMTSVFRSKLFYNKYMYKINFKKYRYNGDMDFFEELYEFAVNSLGDDSYMLNSTVKSYSRLKTLEHKFSPSTLNNSLWQRRFIPYTATGTIYLKDYDDVCTVHLMFKQHITSSAKVVLTSEL